MTMTTTEKTYENLLRRVAKRQGFELVKSRRRDPRATTYGRYLLVPRARVSAFRALDDERAEAKFVADGVTLAEIEVKLAPGEIRRTELPRTREPRTEMAAGDRYGHWTVLSTATTRDDKYTTMLCRCDCGTERRVKTQNLRLGKTQSCGECEYSVRPAVEEPVAGEVFNWWTVLSITEYGTALCRCRCGRERRVNTRRLRSGDSKSCGCRAKWRTGAFEPTKFGEEAS
jgi:hypothetical protein